MQTPSSVSKWTWESLVPLADGSRFCSQALDVSEIGLWVEQALALGWRGHKHWAGGLLHRRMSHLAWVRCWRLPWAHQTRLIVISCSRSSSTADTCGHIPHQCRRRSRYRNSPPSTLMLNLLACFVEIMTKMMYFLNQRHDTSDTLLQACWVASGTNNQAPAKAPFTPSTRPTISPKDPRPIGTGSPSSESDW